MLSYKLKVNTPNPIQEKVKFAQHQYLKTISGSTDQEECFYIYFCTSVTKEKRSNLSINLATGNEIVREHV